MAGGGVDRTKHRRGIASGKRRVPGHQLREEEGKILIDNLVFGSPAEAAGLDFDREITAPVLVVRE